MIDKNSISNQVQQLSLRVLALKQEIAQKEAASKLAVEEKKRLEEALKAKELEYKQKEQELQRIKDEIPQIKRKATQQEEISKKINNIEIPNLKKELQAKEAELARVRQSLVDLERQMKK